MKLIDFFIKNFQAASFIKNLKLFKKGEGWCEYEIRVKDHNLVCSDLSYLKFFKGDLQSIFGSFEPLKKKQVIKFFKEKKEINKENIEKFFFKKEIYGLNIDDNFDDDDDFDSNELLKTYLFQGLLFQKVKEFSLIYKGQIQYKDAGLYTHSIICFYSSTDKKYHLLLLFLEEDGNDSYQYLATFKNKPSINEIKFKIKSKKKSISFYQNCEENEAKIILYKPPKNIILDKYWSKQLKKPLNLEYKERPIYNDEKSFYEIFKSNVEIDYNYVIDNPKVYLRSRNPAPYFNTYLKRNPKKKIKSSKFCNYILNDNLNYKNDINFWKSIEFTYCLNLNGLLNEIPKKLLENKSLSGEINNVKIFRTNNKQLLVKIFNANKNDLYNVVKKYLPQNKFNDRYLVKKMVEIDTDTISLIGEKLKNNKKFMKEIYA